MTFYLKYRLQNLDELDLESVRDQLKKISGSGNIPHALLFSGPKGSGKTSSARILAKILNCEKPGKGRSPCNKCTQCKSISNGTNIDVIEIDAASHRGIDDVRALRDAVKLAPVLARKKVYIVDEAHMLTTEASNALLKTLEEPPEHVVFILVTTNPEKLIETIRSRVTNIYFKKGGVSEVVRALTRVSAGEKAKIDKKVLELIADYSEGSFRDAIKTLELIISEGIKLSEEEIKNYLYKTESFNADSFLVLLSEKKGKEAIEAIEKAIEAGVTAKNISHEIIQRLRAMLLSAVGVGNESKLKASPFAKPELLSLTKLFSEAQAKTGASVIEQLPLEIAVIEATNREGDEEVVKKNEDNKEEKLVSSQVVEKEEVINGDGVNDEVWTRVLTAIRPKNTSTEALLRASKPLGFDGKTLTLGVYYKFHKERLEGTPHRDILEAAISTIFGSPVRVSCALTEPPQKVVNEIHETQDAEKNAKSEVVLTEGEDQDIIKVAKEVFGN